MNRIKGISCGYGGVVIARAHIQTEKKIVPEHYRGTKGHEEEEQEKFYRAREEVRHKLRELAAEDEIFNAHQALLDDVELEERVKRRIFSGQENVQEAVADTVQELEGMLQCLEDSFIGERAADIADVGKRLLIALKEETDVFSEPEAEEDAYILVTEELLPSDAVKLNHNRVKGVITRKGGKNSHGAIMAVSRGIPVITGVENIMDLASENILLCMDAERGEVVIEPSEEQRREFEQRRREYEELCRETDEYAKGEAHTLDGTAVEVAVNAGTLEEICRAIERGAAQIGLFRSEGIFMEQKNFPGEQQQYEIYKAAAQICPGEVTIRTLDIGGDKQMPWEVIGGNGTETGNGAETEKNPALGWRGIRLSLERRAEFKKQIRAILRAGAFGKVRMMFPMIASVEEFRDAKALVEECRQELKREDMEFDADMPIGMMAETPAAAILAETFAKEADFFSIGTNDLTQYILAADRENEKTQNLCSSFHPAVLKAISMIVRGAEKENCRVSLCGELAGDSRASSLLLGMGVREFSMALSAVNKVKKVICGVDLKSAEKMAEKIQECRSAQEVCRLLQERN